MLAAALAGRYGFACIDALGDRTAPLLINATPLGMEGPEADTLAFPEAAIAACATAFDVVALPSETPFLTAAQKRDIFYNNAARFLRLSDAQIARHHGR